MGRTSLLKTISLDELKQMYDNNGNCERVASMLGCSAATVYKHLQGYTGRGRGGICASRIPKEEFAAKAKPAEETIEEKNNKHACLVVDGRTISLVGAVGAYEVCAKEKTVYCTIDNVEIKLNFDIVEQFTEELKAIGRNLCTLNSGNEMW